MLRWIKDNILQPIKDNILQPIKSLFSRLMDFIRKITTSSSRQAQYAPIPDTASITSIASNHEKFNLGSLPEDLLKNEIYSKLNEYDDKSHVAFALASSRCHRLFCDDLTARKHIHSVPKRLEKFFNFEFAHTYVIGIGDAPSELMLGSFMLANLLDEGLQISLHLPAPMDSTNEDNAKHGLLEKMLDFFDSLKIKYTASVLNGGMGSQIYQVTIERNQLEDLGKKLESQLIQSNNASTSTLKK